jgi:hypothetical protein
LILDRQRGEVKRRYLERGGCRTSPVTVDSVAWRAVALEYFHSQPKSCY